MVIKVHCLSRLAVSQAEQRQQFQFVYMVLDRRQCSQSVATGRARSKARRLFSLCFAIVLFLCVLCHLLRAVISVACPAAAQKQACSSAD